MDAYSQDTIRISTELIKETAIYGGYSFNTGDTANKKSHIIEIGIWKSKYVTHIEPANFNYYIGTEFLIHDSQLAIGPKIGSYVGLWMFCLGTDLIYYTDFNESALRLVPYVGFGGHSFKLTFNFYANLTNKEFIYTNPLSINLAIQLKSLKRK
ncbi:hypothetical protein [Carboxylicivirga linearis]|uniref:DUF3575 domain-containing protein n=1 Tax=Carboxylicivirga linearis TaxID=1628157 RepID=A0ABS5K134_9BACT|nr:hypothetical protein [Carboxylicivirga linearis]MBS2100823.1 hypothetical protein [Carboxylicivirga linearis]